MEDIRFRIKRRREELGMSQDELAHKMGYKSKSSINKIELGINDIPQSKVVAFARALDTTVLFLVGGNASQNAEPEKAITQKDDGLDDLDRELLAILKECTREEKQMLLAGLKLAHSQKKES